MGTEIDDLEQMMQTLATASSDPEAVSVGEFAKAVQSLQAELKMLEMEVDRLGSTVGDAFGTGTDKGADAAVAKAAETADQIAANKP